MPYKKFKGVTFAIDRPKGYVKTWPLPNGGVKRYRYPCDYGYFPTLIAADGEGLDAFVGNTENGHFESFEKLKPASGGGYVHDEFKFIVGLNDAELRAVYELYGRNELNARRVYSSFAALLRAAYATCGKTPPTQKAAMMANPTFYVTPQGPQQMESQDFDHLWEKFHKYGAAAAHRKLWPTGMPLELPFASLNHKREPQEADIQSYEDDAFDAIDRGDSVAPTGDETIYSASSGEDKTSSLFEYAPALKDDTNIDLNTRSGITTAFEANEELGEDSSMPQPGVNHFAEG